MAKTLVAQLPARLYELLLPLSPEERTRVVQATLVLFGEDLPVEAPPGAVPPRAVPRPGSSITDAGTYFDEKAPKNKGEMLAVAARFRERIQRQETHSKADLKKVFTDVRRNFDDANFARDMNNAKRQAGFFNLGGGRNATKLSYYGQQFVDALPDREAASKLRRPKIGGGRKRAANKKATKKKGKV